MRVPAGCPLSSRQWQVLELLARGRSQKQIALRLGITAQGVRSVLHLAYKALGVCGGPAAIALSYSAGWMDPVDTSWGDGRLTAAQHLYLRAFDKFMAARHVEDAQERARAEMRHHLGSLRIEHGIAAPAVAHDRRRPDEAMDRLLAVVVG